MDWLTNGRIDRLQSLDSLEEKLNEGDKDEYKINEDDKNKYNKNDKNNNNNNNQYLFHSLGNVFVTIDMLILIKYSYNIDMILIHIE